MFTIATLNKISPKGLACLTNDYQVIDDAAAANGILVRSQDMKTLDFSDQLLAIARAGAGVNNIPLDRCADQGIVVFNTPGANANAVKELVLAGLLLTARRLEPALAWVKTLDSDVAKAVEAGKSQFAGREIQGQTIGVMGLGAIGVLVANACIDLGLNVIGYDPYLTLKSVHALSPKVRLCDQMADLLPQCDYVTIHVPYMGETKHLFNAETLALLKPEACLLNFSRDAIVDDRALLAALADNRLKQYVTDFPNDTVVNQEGVLCLPHLGASTEESEENCAQMAVEEIMDYLQNGNIRNSVNYPAIDLGRLTGKTRLVVLHRSQPEVLAAITGTLAEFGFKAANLVNRQGADYSVTAADLDGPIDPAALQQAFKHQGILRVRVLTSPATPH